MMTGTDVAVVGGGIIGCMTARELADRFPDLWIPLLDQEAVGSGASRQSAGLHIPRGLSQRVRRMTAYSQGYYGRLKQARPSLPIYPLEMFVVTRAENAPALAEHYLPGILSPAPGLPGEIAVVAEGSGVWRAEGSQRAEVAVLARELLSGQRRIRCYEGVSVSCAQPGDAGVLLRLSTGDTLTAARVILAPGPWIGSPAWRELVAPLGARVKKIVALHIGRPPAASDPVIVFEDEDAFLLPLPERGIWLFSYTCQEWDVAPGTLPPGLSAGDLTQARAVLRRHAPVLEDQCTGGRVFCDAYSPSREPLVQRLDNDGRIVFAGAANGSGYRLAPAIAAEAMDLLKEF